MGLMNLLMGKHGKQPFKVESAEKNMIDSGEYVESPGSYTMYYYLRLYKPYCSNEVTCIHKTEGCTRNSITCIHNHDDDDCGLPWM
jgi:hypothetical protein